jgi:hypothetical protein
MSLLSALALGLLIGLLTGGRLTNLATLRLRWWVPVLLALAIQLVIFTPFLPIPQAWLPPAYVTSDLLALVFVLANAKVAGMPVVAVGSASNLLAIVANGGRMPVDAHLLALARGQAYERAVAAGQEASNSVIAGAQTRLGWLTDRILIPPPFPLPTVISIGDLLIAAGIVWVMAAGMHRTEAFQRYKSRKWASQASA